MNGETAMPAVTHDRLLGGRVWFDQPADGYRAAIDPVLLAAAIPARHGESVLELGSGAGAASLCLAARVPDCSVTGVERDAQLVAIANANAAANDMADRVRFIVGDSRDAVSRVSAPAFDHAIANPPFLDPARADLRKAASPRRRDAMVEFDTPLSAWLEAMCRSVKPKGRITLIHRADRLAEILALLRPLAGDIAIQPLWPKAGAAARRIIVTARPGTSAPLRLLSGFVLHDENGSFTAAAAAILNDGAALGL
jgi:tRNA1(Val) A37 N6-methylase TrmN6